MKTSVKLLCASAVLAGLLGGCGTATGPAAPAPKNSTTQNTTITKPQSTNSQQTYDTITTPDGKKVQAINDDNAVDVGIQQTAVLNDYTLLGNVTKPKQGEFFAVELAVKNLTKGPIAFLTTDFAAYDSQGAQYMPSDMDSAEYSAAQNVQANPTINPHEVTQTWVMFDIPKGTKIVKIVHHDETNNKDLVWPVQQSK